jgi:hypothetical protein
MFYIVESIDHTNNLITVYYRANLKEANKWAQFLKDNYQVDTEVYTDCDYMELHPEQFI